MKIRIDISGMHCDACVDAIRSRIQHVAGVTGCEIRVGAATVDFDDAGCNRSDIFEAVRAAGAFEVDGFSTE